MPVILATWEADKEDSGSKSARANSLKDQPPISKLTRAKWISDVAQAVETLLCKGKAMSSNPSFTKNK
jgi:hypothetical protein